MSFDVSYPRGPIRELLLNPDTFATTMVVALIDVYGTEFLAWSPETTRMETEEDFSFKWRATNFDRLMAGIALLKTDSFYRSLPDFIELCNILSGSGATPGVFDPADALECAWGITEALLLSPPDSDEPFDEEIRAYIGKVVEMEGIIVPPDILKIGILDQDRKHRITADFSDDPEMFNAVWDTEAQKTEEINEVVKARLFALVSQLQAVRLQNGNTEEIAKKMLTNLNNRPTGGSPLS
jgi:hypothetical protein